MKAVVLTQYGSPSALQIVEVEKPIPKNNEVLIRVQATSVNDWDWCMIRGKPFYIRLLCGFRKPKIRIPGVDVAGRIEAVGSEIKNLKAGDEVHGDLSEVGFGAFAEYVCAPESALALKPKKMTFVEAAALPHAGMLAVQGLIDRGNLQPEQKLLVNGAGGGVGTLAVQIARGLGVVDITGVDSERKLGRMQTLGYKEVIDYEQEDFTKNSIRYDMILDTKTNRSIFHCIRALSPRGLYITVGGTTIRLLQAFIFGPFVRLFGNKKIGIVALKTNKDLDYINELYEAGRLKPIIDGPYPLYKAMEAIELFGQGKHIGKVIISMEN